MSDHTTYYQQHSLKMNMEVDPKIKKKYIMYLSLNISVIKCAVCVMFAVFVCVCVYIGIQCDISVCVYIYKFVVFEYVCLHW